MSLRACLSLAGHRLGPNGEARFRAGLQSPLPGRPPFLFPDGKPVSESFDMKHFVAANQSSFVIPGQTQTSSFNIFDSVSQNDTYECFNMTHESISLLGATVVEGVKQNHRTSLRSGETWSREDPRYGKEPGNSLFNH